MAPGRTKAFLEKAKGWLPRSRSQSTRSRTTCTQDDTQLQATTHAVHTRVAQSVVISHTTTSSISEGNSVAEGPPSDIWSAAFSEAVKKFEGAADEFLHDDKSLQDLFTELIEVDKSVVNDNAFLRGIKQLERAKGPLENFKMALDVATPVASIEPTAALVVGIVRSVTVFAITLASVDVAFAKSIGEMLEKLSYIDECDTLGQKTNEKDIHKALVAVYLKVIEFYKLTHDILLKKGMKMILAMVSKQEVFPRLVAEFSDRASDLQNIIQRITLQITNDIRDMLYDQNIASWLGSGQLQGQADFHASVRHDCCDEASAPMVKDIRIAKWLNSSDQQTLIIHGPLGFGKTVVSAFLIEHLTKRRQHLLPRPLVCYHYCRRGQSAEALQIFSTLLASILRQLQGLKRGFCEWYKKHESNGQIQPTRDVLKLETFLLDTIEALERPIIIVIDGVDECDSATRRRLQEFLARVPKQSMTSRVLISMRSDKAFFDGLQDDAVYIELLPDTSKDLRIAGHLVRSRLSDLDETSQNIIIEKLTSLSKGSLIWTQLVVDLVAVRRASKITPALLRFFDTVSLPEQLMALYSDVLVHTTLDDRDNRKLAIAALRILAAVRRPLTISELTWAATIATMRPPPMNIAELADSVDGSRVLSMIYPFIAHFERESKHKRQLQLNHESARTFVKDHLTVEEMPLLCMSPLSTSYATAQQTSACLETFMLDICVAYLLIEDVGVISLFTEEQDFMRALPADEDIFRDVQNLPSYDGTCSWEEWEKDMPRFDPSARGLGEFFVYASCFWVRHFASVNSGTLLRLSDLETMCQQKSVRLDNWTKQNARPECTYDVRFEFHSHLYDPLSIAALYGSEAMLCHIFDTADLTSRHYLPNTLTNAIDQIIQFGDTSRIRLFLEREIISKQVRTVEFVRVVLRLSDSHPDHSSRLLLLMDVLDLVISMPNEVSNLWQMIYTVLQSNNAMVINHVLGHIKKDRALLDRCSNVSPLRPSGSSFLVLLGSLVERAVTEGRLRIVQDLLAHDGLYDFFSQSHEIGSTILHLAAYRCDPAMIEYLVGRFPQLVDKRDGSGHDMRELIASSGASEKLRAKCMEIVLYTQYSSASAGKKHISSTEISVSDQSSSQ